MYRKDHHLSLLTIVYFVLVPSSIIELISKINAYYYDINFVLVDTLGHPQLRNHLVVSILAMSHKHYA